MRNISPIDGRYKESVRELSNYFSEFALMKYRVHIEILYLQELAKHKIIRQLTANEMKMLHALFTQFSEDDAKQIKMTEQEIQHDVKAVEYFLVQKLEKSSLQDVQMFIHFGITSEDVTNLAYATAMQQFVAEQYLPKLSMIQSKLAGFAQKYADVTMVGRTHGQVASPTTIGKEFAVFAHRLRRQLPLPKLTGKLNGAVGNYNALATALPTIDWIGFSRGFVTQCGLEPNLITTQIEDRDRIAALFHAMVRINNILIDLCRDIWLYLSHDIFFLQSSAKEIGSSTMPHKVNPIDFENAEGNLEIANALFVHFADKLTKSRLQRDLSGSTVQRNMGVALGHCMVAFEKLHKGLEKIVPNTAKIKEEITQHPEVLAEAIQTILRREKVPDAYELLKDLTRGKHITLREIHAFIDTLPVSDKVKKELLQLTPEKYVGLAAQLARMN